MKSILIALVLLTAGCEQKVTAVHVPGTHCNARQRECPGGGCCSLSDDCGGIYPNCPVNYCCAGDDDGRLWSRQRDAGAPRMTPQWRPEGT